MEEIRRLREHGFIFENDDEGEVWEKLEMFEKFEDLVRDKNFLLYELEDCVFFPLPYEGIVGGGFDDYIHMKRKVLEFLTLEFKDESWFDLILCEARIWKKMSSLIADYDIGIMNTRKFKTKHHNYKKELRKLFLKCTVNVRELPEVVYKTNKKNVAFPELYSKYMTNRELYKRLLETMEDIEKKINERMATENDEDASLKWLYARIIIEKDINFILSMCRPEGS